MWITGWPNNKTIERQKCYRKKAKLMKTAFYLITTCALSVGAVILTANTLHIATCVVFILAIWSLFTWGYLSRSKKATARKIRERLFQQHMRSILNNPRY